jgi:hypothetical protein
MMEAMMWWTLTKTIIISWFIGVICGEGMVVVLQQENRIPPPATANSQTAPQTSGIAAPPDGDARN